MFDFRIIYKAGETAGFVVPLTSAGRMWLAGQVKSPRINNSAMVQAEELLKLIANMQGTTLTAYWKKAE